MIIYFQRIKKQLLSLRFGLLAGFREPITNPL